MNIFKKSLVVTIAVIILITSFTGFSFAKNDEDIIILYENDVHCAIEGYSKLSALKKELLENYTHVGVVSSGDYIQGGSIGIISKGKYIIDIMNLVGYDALTLGNHEFDYRISRLDELVNMMNTKPVSCNFQKIEDSESYYDPYTIVKYGDTDVAYIGITTPSTISASYPAQYKDENGNYIFTFNVDKLYEVVQNNIDKAKAEGADYIIALSHIGYEEDEQFEDVVDLIANTNGFDVVLDAHSHSVIEHMVLKDNKGNDVVLTSTGTKFEHIGKLTISDGEFKTELIKVEEYTKTDPVIDQCIKNINDEVSEVGNRIVAESEVDLVIEDKDGNRLVRVEETNLGDFCSDAFRTVTGADIGYVNGGGIRANLLKGDITFNDLLNVFPYNNLVVVVELTGQAIKDMLENCMALWPIENGSFPHVSGVTFSVNKAIDSSVMLDINENFIGVEGQYRVYNIKVLNKNTGEYEPIDLNKKYTLASHNYYLLEYGGGMSMLEDSKVILNDGMLDVELLEKYVIDNLDGVIGQDYKDTVYNITFTDGEISEDNDNPDTSDNNYIVICLFAIVLCSLSKKYFMLSKR